MTAKPEEPHLCVAGRTTEAVAKGTKALDARVTGVTQIARLDPGIPEVPGEGRDGNGERFVSYEVQVHLKWKMYSPDG